MDTPDWNDLRYFLAVITSGSLSAAARSLGVEHTTVSRRIEALEKVLGVRLFDRFARGWSLTAPGEALLPQAQRVEQEIQGLLRQAAGAGDGHGTVRISAPPAIAAHWIAPRLAGVHAQLSGIQIELGAEPAQVDLSRREAEIAIRFRRPSAPDLAARVVAIVKYYLCATPEYLASHNPDQWEFIGYDESLAETPQQEWLDAFAAGRPYVFFSNDLNSIAAAVSFGAGIAILPDYLATGLVIPDIICPVRRELWMVVHDDVRKSPRVRHTADLIAELFSSPAN